MGANQFEERKAHRPHQQAGYLFYNFNYISSVWFDQLVAIEEQLARGRDLTKKMASVDSEDEEVENYDEILPTKEPFLDAEDPGEFIRLVFVELLLSHTPIRHATSTNNWRWTT